MATTSRRGNSKRDRVRIYGGWKEAMSDRLENLMSRASELVVSHCYLEPCATGKGVRRQENNWKGGFWLDARL
jgi:hypothetical protein